MSINTICVANSNNFHHMTTSIQQDMLWNANKQNWFCHKYLLMPIHVAMYFFGFFFLQFLLFTTMKTNVKMNKNVWQIQKSVWKSNIFRMNKTRKFARSLRHLFTYWWTGQRKVYGIVGTSDASIHTIPYAPNKHKQIHAKCQTTHQRTPHDSTARDTRKANNTNCQIRVAWRGNLPSGVSISNRRTNK